MQKNKHILQILFAVSVLTAVSISFSAHAQTTYQYTPLATIPIGTTGPTGNLTTAGQAVDPAAYIKNLYVFAFSIGIAIAVVSGVWAGVEYMLSESVTNKSNALGRIQNVGWGFALLLCSYVILDLINPQLVNFNINLGTIGTENFKEDLSTASSSLAALEAEQANQAQIENQASQQAQTAANGAQSTIDGIKAQLNSNPPPTPEQKAVLEAQLVTAQANLDYQNFQQSYIKSFSDMSSNIATGNNVDIGSVKTSLANEISTLQNTLEKTQDPGLQNTLNSEIQTLQSKQNDITTIQNGIGNQNDLFQRITGSIKSYPAPSSDMTAASYEQNLLNTQYLLPNTDTTVSASKAMQTVAGNSKLSNSEIQGIQQVYTNLYNANITATAKAQCEVYYKTGC
jgi:hypothetical protein